ncbi:hypothetical protein KIL84_017192 [Mauremys mutica]|uniref:Uncharacterized protein n=1 Tax=Mauremys mutica TaxID=74926 RepID=A0A9D4AWL3_9SAUR|nr:hypothetical protein KIL84_017192 [Mauremys mutica]
MVCDISFSVTNRPGTGPSPQLMIVLCNILSIQITRPLSGTMPWRLDLTSFSSFPPHGNSWHRKDGQFSPTLMTQTPATEALLVLITCRKPSVEATVVVQDRAWRTL